jgi:molybdopterin molybdotransferase
MAGDSRIQRISRLTPLAAIRALADDRIGAVTARTCPVWAARGRVLAADVTASDLPPQPIALRDGFAVEAAALGDAGPYAPVPLPALPQRIDAGEPMPAGTDAVLPLDGIVVRGSSVEAIAGVAAGEGVLAARGDAAKSAALLRAGKRLRDHDIAAIAAAGLTEVAIREPRIHLAGGGSRTPLIEATLAMLAHVVASAGGAVVKEIDALDIALADEKADLVIAVGGTGSGRRDAAVQTLARLGRVEAHGIAISPGDTAAFGFAGTRPVLLIPGRLDAALAVWLLVGRHLVAGLAGGSVGDAPAMLPLKRKVTSAIGMTELVPVRRLRESSGDDMAEPLATGYLSLTALAQSDGWIVVSADSEGHAAGTIVAVNPWP